MTKLSRTTWIAAILLAGVASVRADVVINELMYHTLPDDDRAEFIEIFNRGTEAVALQNWCVRGVLFCFPAGATIGAGEYLVLAGDPAFFRLTYGFDADFDFDGRLDNGGETIELVDAQGQVVDAVDYDDRPPWPVKPDGLGPSLERIDADQPGDTPRNWRASVAGARHTAGEVNSVDADGLPPWISEAAHGGQPDPDVDVIVTARVEDADEVTLHYRYGFDDEVTTAMLDDGAHGDGAPDDGVYGATIPGQSARSLIRYRIEARGPTGAMWHPRADDSVVYDGSVVRDPNRTSPLPVLEWFMRPEDYDQAIEHRETDETEEAVAFFDGALYDNIRVRVRGHISRQFLKNHWKFRFARNHDLLAPEFHPLPVDQVHLQANYADKSHLREILAYETFRDAGLPGSLTEHARIELNGIFYGLYTLIEVMDDDYLERNAIDPEGAWYKAFDDARARSLNDLRIRYEKQTRQFEGYNDLFAFLSGINNLTGDERRDFIFDNVDLPPVINYLAATCVIHNNDHVAKNYFLYRDTLGTRRWLIHPFDLDLTFGRSYQGNVLNDDIFADQDDVGRDNVSPSHPLFGDSEHQKWDFRWNRLIDKLYEDDDVREMYHRRLRTLTDELLLPGLYERRIVELVPPIREDFELDRQAWPQYGQQQTIDQAVNLILDEYLPRRRIHLLDTHRVPGEIPRRQSLAPEVVINEIMYDPDGADVEFVELFNPSEFDSVDVSHWRLEGAALTLPGGSVILPSGFLLLVGNDVEFRAGHAPGHYVAAEFSGSLANEGERIALVDARGRIVDEVVYDEQAPWPVAAAGAGPSLELIDPTRPRNHPANWAASVDSGGTPGAPNSVAGEIDDIPQLFINEIQPVNTATIADEQGEFEPWIEVYNPSDAPFDLAGYALTNDHADPFLSVIPEDVIVPARGWLIFWADGEPGEGPRHTTFRLADTGGAVGLYDQTGRIIAHANYDALPADVSLGPVPDGDHARRRMDRPTPGAANELDPTPIFLNEYNAVDEDEFLKDGAADTFWGRVEGNGGDWFELVVGADHVDARGWQLRVSDDTGGGGENVQLLTLTDDPLWSDLRVGTIITVSAELDDDPSYDPLGGDWWINVRGGPGGSGTYVSTEPFTVSNDRWQLTILDEEGAVAFGPAGEGINPPSGIGNDEVFKLEEDPHPYVDPFGAYEDGSSSTFGAPNRYADGTLVQDFAALRSAIGFDLSLLIDEGARFVHPGDAVEVTLHAANLESAIDGVTALIEYNPWVLELESIEPVALDLQPPAEGWIETQRTDDLGDLTYAVAIEGAEGVGASADGPVAVLRFRAIAEGVTDLRFRTNDGNERTRMTRASDGGAIIPRTHDPAPIVVQFCDDGDPCTEDVVDEHGCSFTPIEDCCVLDGECDDVDFCNGAETCVDNVCVPGAPPCDDEEPCAFCDAEAQVCGWCVFDHDRSGETGSLDFAFFAGCFGGCYAPNDDCIEANYDVSPDGCVGSADFAALAGCFGLTCGECENCEGP